jgi:hypothetical protein
VRYLASKDRTLGTFSLFFGDDEVGRVICCSALLRWQAWSDRTHERHSFNVRRDVLGRMLIALVTLLSRVYVRVAMSDFVASLNDQAADHEQAKKEPKTLSGYFDWIRIILCK